MLLYCVYSSKPTLMKNYSLSNYLDTYGPFPDHYVIRDYDKPYRHEKIYIWVPNNNIAKYINLKHENVFEETMIMVHTAVKKFKNLNSSKSFVWSMHNKSGDIKVKFQYTDKCPENAQRGCTKPEINVEYFEDKSV